MDFELAHGLAAPSGNLCLEVFDTALGLLDVADEFHHRRVVLDGGKKVALDRLVELLAEGLELGFEPTFFRSQFNPAQCGAGNPQRLAFYLV